MHRSVLGARAMALLVMGVVLAALGLGGAVPAGADQADSAVGRVAAASIAAGQDDTCALLATGAVRCWGYNGFGQLGHDTKGNVGDGGGPSIQTSGDVPLGGKATAVATGSYHTCALLATGAVRCWGEGGAGELGHDTASNVGDGGGDPSIQDAGDVPLGGEATAITAGDSHTCALLSTGAVRCWGYGGDGELGHGATDNIGDGGGDLSIKDAGDVPLGGRATAISAGAYHTCALMVTGAVRCWGYGGDGQLGHNASTSIGDGGGDPSIQAAGDVPLGGTAVAITAGAFHTCALLTTGGVRCWGSGFFGQLGHDSSSNVGDGGGDPSIKDVGNVPVGGTPVAVTAGNNHTCALLTTGGVRCWGLGRDGELGHDSVSNIGDGGGDLSIKDAGDVPVGGRASAVTGGADHTCALLSTGALHCWGFGFFGQLGHNTPDSVGDGGTGPSITDAGDVPVGGRVRGRAPTALSAGIGPTRDRHAPYVYRVTGRLHGLFVADAATCTGHLKVTIRHGRRLLKAHTTRLHADCAYRLRTRLTKAQLPTSRSARLTIKVHYLGTHNLAPAAAIRHATAN
jgi:alpha-tubulin suppressor-like RCC1 family protein